jgi:hypothetical protein
MRQPFNPPRLVCRQCGATPERRRDAVSGQALGYTCGLCLVGVQALKNISRLPPYGVGSGTPSRTRIKSGDLGRVFVPSVSSQGTRQGGRPRKHASEVIAHREARRAYRARQLQRSTTNKTEVTHS